jgi:hypothetical protein
MIRIQSAKSVALMALAVSGLASASFSADASKPVVELTNPKVDGKDMVYQYKVIEGAMPKAGGATALFIELDWNRRWSWTRLSRSWRRSPGGGGALINHPHAW